MSMYCANLYESRSLLQIEKAPIPEMGDSEILVEVHACGLCGTDVHLAVARDFPVAFSPITLGHEIAGIVKEAGKNVKELVVGDRVCLFPAAFCNHCQMCQQNRHSLCFASKVYGMGRNGGLAEFISVPAVTAIKLADNIPFEIGAIATDAVATPFHALKRGQLQPGESVAIVGCGGLGQHAIMLARLLGAKTIVAIDQNPKANKRALELGANISFTPEAVDKKEIAKLTGYPGCDLVLEFVGKKVTVELAMKIANVGGRCVLVGVGQERANLPKLLNFVAKELTVMGSFGMGIKDICEVLELIASKKLDLSQTITHRFALPQINEALELLSDSKSAKGRIVVFPKI